MKKFPPSIRLVGDTGAAAFQNSSVRKVGPNPFGNAIHQAAFAGHALVFVQELRPLATRQIRLSPNHVSTTQQNQSFFKRKRSHCSRSVETWDRLFKGGLENECFTSFPQRTTRSVELKELKMRESKGICTCCGTRMVGQNSSLGPVQNHRVESRKLVCKKS